MVNTWSTRARFRHAPAALEIVAIGIESRNNARDRGDGMVHSARVRAPDRLRKYD